MPNKQQVTKKMEAAIDHLAEELKNIRTGRAHANMLDGVVCEVYGSDMRLKDVATVTVPELRQLLITPFDANNASAIAKGIEKSNLGMNPSIDGHVIRLNVPPMDEALRKEMVKVVNKKKEEAKVSIRNIRRDGNEEIRKMKNDNDITEDVMHKSEKSIQELTDQFCKKADDMGSAKENEVMTV